MIIWNSANIINNTSDFLCLNTSTLNMCATSTQCRAIVNTINHSILLSSSDGDPCETSITVKYERSGLSSIIKPDSISTTNITTGNIQTSLSVTINTGVVGTACTVIKANEICIAHQSSCTMINATDICTTHLNCTGSACAQSFYATSDRRLKTNIIDYVYHDSILDIPVKEFTYKSTGDRTIGFIAQDLQKEYPELVKIDKDGYLSIAQDRLIYLLLEEVKELKQEIQNLKDIK